MLWRDAIQLNQGRSPLRWHFVRWMGIIIRTDGAAEWKYVFRPSPSPSPHPRMKCNLRLRLGLAQPVRGPQQSGEVVETDRDMISSKGLMN